MRAPLEGVRVVAVDSFMAAPSAGAILADLGADVIKIEPLTGDPIRGMGRPAKVDGDLRSYDLQFDVDNRGKRSIAIALDTAEGAALAQRLAGQAQVFMCNLLPHRQERFGLDSASLMAINPSIVHATLTGYGTNGPDATRPGYDVTAFFGRSGLYDAMREGDDGIVPNARPAQGDHTAGIALVAAILAGLRVAEATGDGQVVETSLFEAAVWTQASDFAITAVDQAPVRRRRRTEMITPAANRFPCGDGHWIVLNNLGTTAWDRMCGAMGLDDLIDDERFATAKTRFDNMEELIGLLDERFATRTRDEWGGIFDDSGVIWGPVLGLHEVAVDPQAEAIGLFPSIEHPVHGTYRTVRSPMRFEGLEVGPRGPSPKTGEHTREVLESLGLSADEIDELVATDVAG
jgi:crotonobetainyl-CoA:carnitine CoA-transferase CaiB-like acyl-CoA transferase